MQIDIVFFINIAVILFGWLAGNHYDWTAALFVVMQLEIVFFFSFPPIQQILNYIPA